MKDSYRAILEDTPGERVGVGTPDGIRVKIPGEIPK